MQRKIAIEMYTNGKHPHLPKGFKRKAHPALFAQSGKAFLLERIEAIGSGNGAVKNSCISG